MTTMRRWLTAAAMIAAFASAVAAQVPPVQPQTQAPPPTAAAPAVAGSPAGEITFGARVNSMPAVGRFMRYDDLRSGPTIESLRYSRARNDWTFDARAANVGYRDQRYAATVDRPGRLRASFLYDQVPLWYGDVERTPYREENPGVFRLDDTVQAAVQNQTATIAAYGSQLRDLDLRSRRDTARGGFGYSLTRNLDLSVLLTSTHRVGEQPWGAPFGLSNTTVVPVPLDRRTNDLTAAAEWSNGRAMARLAYDGSWFANGVDTLVWDNPLRFTDTTTPTAYTSGTGSSQGRMSLWPDSTAHTVSGSGSFALPHRSRLFAYASVGAWLQNDDLLPFTINTAIPPVAMPRATAEAKAIITAMNYRYTSRPTANTWFSASYRLYDFDNQSEPFPLINIVRVDQTLAPSPLPETEPFGYMRQFVDVDGSYTGFGRVALRAGYGLEHDDRTYRYVETTADHQVRASIDSAGLSWGSLRLQYDHSIRTGSGLDEQVFEEINEQISLRQFDIANRTRDRLSAIAQYLPAESLGISGSLSVGRERRPDSAFGLQDNDVRSVTVGVDYTPAAAVTFGVQYSYENYATLQRSRQANPPPDPTFFDPRRDWQTDMDEHVNTISASVDLPRIAPRTALRLAYDTVHDNARYEYLLAPDSTLPPVQQLPNVVNTFGLVTVDVTHTLSGRLAVGAGYRLDHFDTNDFALTPGVMNTPFIPTFFNLQYQWRPYDAHTGFVRLIYRF